MVKNSSKNNKKHIKVRVQSKKKTDLYKKNAKRLGWDSKKTLRQNVASQGLATAINDHASIIRQRGLRLSKTTTSEFLSIVDGISPIELGAAPSTSAKGEFYMKDEEVLYLQVSASWGCSLVALAGTAHLSLSPSPSLSLTHTHTHARPPPLPCQPLVLKYNDNYTAMFRDLKLNNLQHSAQHLETRCKRLANFLTSKSKAAEMEEEGGASSSSSAMRGGGGGSGGMQVEKLPRRRQSLKVIDQPNPAGDDEDLALMAQAGLKVLPFGKLR